MHFPSLSGPNLTFLLHLLPSSSFFPCPWEMMVIPGTPDVLSRFYSGCSQFQDTCLYIWRNVFLHCKSPLLFISSLSLITLPQTPATISVPLPIYICISVVSLLVILCPVLFFLPSNNFVMIKVSKTLYKAKDLSIFNLTLSQLSCSG